MDNGKNDIMIQMYATVAFLTELKNLDFLNSEYYKDVEFQDKYLQKYFKTIGIDNRGSLLFFLYSLLVIPKEFLEDKYPHEFAELNIFLYRHITSFDSTYKNENSKTNLIRHLRNSISHGHVSFLEDNSIKFEDFSKNHESCHIVIHSSKIGGFLSKLQSVLLNLINQISK